MSLCASSFACWCAVSRTSLLRIRDARGLCEPTCIELKHVMQLPNLYYELKRMLVGHANPRNEAELLNVLTSLQLRTSVAFCFFCSYISNTQEHQASRQVRLGIGFSPSCRASREAEDGRVKVVSVLHTLSRCCLKNLAHACYITCSTCLLGEALWLV